MLGAVHGSTLFPDLLNGVPGNHHYSSRGSISVPDVWRLDPLCPCRGLRVRMKEVSISGALTPHLSGLVCSTSTYINPRKPRSSMSLPTHPFLWRFRFSYFLSFSLLSLSRFILPTFSSSSSVSIEQKDILFSSKLIPLFSINQTKPNQYIHYVFLQGPPRFHPRSRSHRCPCSL